MEPNLKFKQLRETLSLSQSEFAAKIGVSQGTIGDIERGRIGISKNVKSKLIEKFGIEIGYFIEEKDAKTVDMKQGTEIGSNQGLSISAVINFIKSNPNYDKSYVIVNQLIRQNESKLNPLKELLQSFFDLNRKIFQFTHQYAMIFNSSYHLSVFDKLENNVSEDTIKEDFNQALDNIPFLIAIYKSLNAELEKVVNKLEKIDLKGVMKQDINLKIKKHLLKGEFEKISSLKEMHKIPDYL